MSAEIEALTEADWRSLRAYARWRMDWYEAGAMRGKDCEDLLQQALLYFLGGKRRRADGQSLVDHLKNVMHSVAGSWSSRKSRSEVNWDFEPENLEDDGH